MARFEKADLLVDVAALGGCGEQISISTAEASSAASVPSQPSLRFSLVAIIELPGVEQEDAQATAALRFRATARAVTVRDDIRRERQMDGIKKARERGIRFGRKPVLVPEVTKEVRKLRKSGITVPEIMRQTNLSKASVYRALGS